MSGSGLFTSKKAKRTHLLQGGGLASEIADVRKDIEDELSPLAAITVEGWTNPAAASTNSLKTSTASVTTAASGTLAVPAGALGARNVTVTTSNHSATWQGNVVFTGKYKGLPQTETLAMANNTTIVGTKPFDLNQPVHYALDAQADALGTYTFGHGTGIGVSVTPKTRAGGVSIIREIIDGTLITTGVLTAAGLYTPATAPDAAHDWTIYFEFVPPGAGAAGAAPVGQSAGSVGKITLSFHEIWRLPDAPGTALKSSLAVNTSLPATLTTQPDYPRTFELVTDGSWASTAQVDVTLTGITKDGDPGSEIISIPANTAINTTIENTHAKALASVSAVSYNQPGGWTAGTFAVKTGTKLGLRAPAGATLTAYKEVKYTDAASPPNPVNATVGTVDATTNTYVPSTTIDGLTDIEVWYVAKDAPVTILA